MKIKIPLMLAAAIFLGGCQSNWVQLTEDRSPADIVAKGESKELGRVEGEACGTMLFLSTAYNFIPVMLNDRVERAYQNALQSVPGAKALKNVQMEETWTWWLIGTTRCTTVQGEAI